MKLLDSRRVIVICKCSFVALCIHSLEKSTAKYKSSYSCFNKQSDRFGSNIMVWWESTVSILTWRGSEGIHMKLKKMYSAWLWYVVKRDEWEELSGIQGDRNGSLN